MSSHPHTVLDLSPSADRGQVRAAARAVLGALPVHSVRLGQTRAAEGGVRVLRLDGSRLFRASVASSGRRTFQVSGRLPASGTGSRAELLALSCSCGWGGSCKHVAAAVLALGDALLEGAATAVHETRARPPARSAPPGSAPPGSAPPGTAPPGHGEATAAPAPAGEWLASLLPRASSGAGDARIAFRLEVRQGVVRVQLCEQRGRGAIDLGAAAMPRPRLRALLQGPPPRGPGVAAALAQVPWDDAGTASLVGARGGHELGLLIDSGRLFLPEAGGARLLGRGPQRDARLAWRLDGDHVLPALEAESVSAVLGTVDPVHYIDRAAGVVGELTVSQGSGFAHRWMSGPPVARAAARAVHAQLRDVAPDLPPPFREVVHLRVPPVGALRLSSSPPAVPGSPARRVAELSFLYGSHRVSRRAGDPVVVVEQEREVHVHRSPGHELALFEELFRRGFTTDASGPLDGSRRLTLPSEVDWLFFLDEDLPALRARGFEVEIDASFQLEILEIEDWYADLEESDNHWFELDVGIAVEGERVAILPLLLEALRQDRRVKAKLWISMGEGRHVAIPRERIEPLVEVLLELAARPPAASRRISRIQALDLAQSARMEGETWAALRRLRAALVSDQRVAAADLPEIFRGVLRPYQAEGVSRLLLLGCVGLGALLADDMGLGKTVQMIALLCVVRGSRERRDPSLVVAPKSATLAWVEQLEAFAPALRVVVWQGPRRHADRALLDTADVVVTSYAIFHRDAEELLGRTWDVAILDEAQVIKNPKTTHSENASRLKARQRIALTGTPIENHLGELWSIVSFAAPGALGSKESFRAAYRNPIERDGNQERLESLRRRLSPILLRRTKEQVATELPPRNVIRHPVELGDGQRDLYEVVRASVKAAVQAAIASKGFDRARIMILDALLKLRQVCCDPRLLKVEALRRRRVSSAKLESFRDLVGTLVGERRSVLVFSQFTEMLDLLAEELADLGVEHATLTGKTRDRAREVERFRAGRVPVFLISLKAGGTGLNLTKADTVIHYDPWWNPAVEDQATDRAHRIGQTRSVMVYKLIARGTIEEKILALQEKKAALARQLFGGPATAGWLDAATLDDLLAPMPGRRGSSARAVPALNATTGGAA